MPIFGRNKPFVGSNPCSGQALGYTQIIRSLIGLPGGNMSGKISSVVFFLTFLLVGVTAHAAGLDDADERLFRVQQSMAQKGNSRAQYYLGEMHEQGLGTRVDLNEAFKWYAKAAEQGDMLAKRKLANREEIFKEAKREQEALEAEKQRKAAAAAVPEPKPAASAPAPKPSAHAKKNAPATPAASKHATAESAPSATVAKAEHSVPDDQARMRAAEKEKRRAKVRALIQEYLRNPKSTDPFE